jgi:hypothetical protein
MDFMIWGAKKDLAQYVIVKMLLCFTRTGKFVPMLCIAWQ